MTKSTLTPTTGCDTAHSVFDYYHVESVVAEPIP